ncbi:NlpC/P60 family protein [Streptomyces ficellus]|uniref:NlpC/P60 family protein n=1 Tax=Streptomyces ficellus TaxID=1977088 RepID=A0ABT7Z9L2_9ACTN|nr:C40 family peptidase [Streptomyces ficellus]MDN3296189.1 NlpC/P60 family protein [Streptomyces ficellus]
MNRRRRATAAITVVCAMTVLVLASPVPAAYAAPMPLPPAPPAPPAGAVGKSLEEVRAEIDTLYRQAASATDAYNLADEQAKKQSAEIVELAQAIVDGQARIEDLKNRAGAAARAQYRNGGIPDGAQLVLTNDPQLFLSGVGRIQQGQKATKDLLAELHQKQADLETYTKDASAHRTSLEATRAQQARTRKQIETKIAAAEKLESQLAAEERARLLALEQDEQSKAQTAWLGSGVLTGIGGSASAQGRKAVEFATAQIGKPYVWGAEGPGSYDCSGLTSQAWAVAGKGIPRTSQEQWRLLPRIDVKDMRPGDLIIYHADASHVGMYIGDGAIVHAPRPGRSVTVAGAGSMAILGVVRPDKQPI